MIRRRRPRGDDGTVLVLVLGFAVVLMAMVTVVVDVSAVLLARRAVASAADGAAVAAAQELDEAAFYAGGVSERVPLSEPQVRDAVARYAAAAGEAQPGLRLAGAVEAGTVAVVQARREVDLPLSGWLRLGSVTVSATARARSPLAG